jgi:hypothetical protein
MKMFFLILDLFEFFFALDLNMLVCMLVNRLLTL